MRVVVVSDTHDNYPDLPDGDLLIHCGDLTTYGTHEELLEGFRWLGAQSHRTKLLVPGNHDRDLEKWKVAEFCGVRILVDRLVHFNGLRIYGTPWTPPWQNFAFMKSEEELREVFARIPEGLDILVTHGPPSGILDWTLRGPAVGSWALRERLGKVTQRPRHHIFGHIHEAFGHKQSADTWPTSHWNCSWVALDAKGPKPPNPPVVIDL